MSQKGHTRIQTSVYLKLKRKIKGNSICIGTNVFNYKVKLEWSDWFAWTLNRHETSRLFCGKSEARKLHLCYNPPRADGNVQVCSKSWDRCLFPYPHPRSPCHPGMLLYYRLSCAASPPGPEPAYVPGTWWHVPPGPSSSPAPTSSAWGSRIDDCVHTCKERKCHVTLPTVALHARIPARSGNTGSPDISAFPNERRSLPAAVPARPARRNAAVSTSTRGSLIARNFAARSRNLVRSGARKTVSVGCARARAVKRVSRLYRDVTRRGSTEQTARLIPRSGRRARDTRR